ncbi:MAG: glycosyltransferase family 2 protein [Lentisphaeria bacterium]|nr:glycosyltransferase family 2 protein [Lentisphaeria bacterium]
MKNIPIPEASLSVVMPVYNEEATICEIVSLVLARPEVGELLIIDDASKDGSWQALQKFRDDPRVKLLQQEVNHGKGAAIIRGFAAASKDYVIVQDADFEYTPEDYPQVIQPLVNGKADAVYGARFMNSPGQVRYFRHEMGNKFLTFLSNVFSDIHLSDMETCYKAFRREVIQNLKLTSERFGIEVELTAKLARSRKLRIWEVPISYQPRRYDEGKKIGWKDGFAALWHIIRFNCFSSDEKSFRRPWEEVLKKPEKNLD